MEADDIERLAHFFEMDVHSASRRYTMEGKEPDTRVMRHFRDPVFGTACRLLDLDARRCTAYNARPKACRKHPGTHSCHYYQFLMTERRIQGKPKLAVRAYNLVNSIDMERHSRGREDDNEGD